VLYLPSFYLPHIYHFYSYVIRLPYHSFLSLLVTLTFYFTGWGRLQHFFACIERGFRYIFSTSFPFLSWGLGFIAFRFGL